MQQTLYTSEMLNCRYDTETGIFYKYYSGNIELDDIIYSWNEIIENELIPKGTKRFLLDYTKANYASAPDTAKQIAQFYTEHKHIFSGAQIALIMQRSDQVIFPVLVAAECPFMSVKPFYSFEGAQYWLEWLV